MNSLSSQKSGADANSRHALPAIHLAEESGPNGRVAPLPAKATMGQMAVGLDFSTSSQKIDVGAPGFKRGHGNGHGLLAKHSFSSNARSFAEGDDMPVLPSLGSSSNLSSRSNQSSRGSKASIGSSGEHSEPPTPPSTRSPGAPRFVKEFHRQDSEDSLPEISPGRGGQSQHDSSSEQLHRKAQMMTSGPSCARGLHATLVNAVKAADVGEVRMLRTVGIGTFGVVKLCELHGSPFVLKIMSKSHVIAYKQRDNTFSEKETLAELSHPFIVKLYKTFNSNLCIYMLLQYIPGGELFSFLRRERTLSLSLAQFYTAQMVLALQYLVSKEIVYRDLKPENLLIDARGYVIMTDFGFAKQVPPGDRCFTMCGTPEYMAPEVILRQPGYSHPVDWWAVGVLLYEMLVGRSPFQSNDTKKVYRGVLRGKVDYDPVTDPTARDLIRRLLIRDPEKRGVYQGGELQTQRHRFFRGVDWDRLYLQELDAPYRPVIHNVFDTSCFDEYGEGEEREVLKLLGSENVETQLLHENTTQSSQDEFAGFEGCFVRNEM